MGGNQGFDLDFNMGMKDIFRMVLGIGSLYDADLGDAGKHFEHKDTSKRKALAKRRKKNKNKKTHR